MRYALNLVVLAITVFTMACCKNQTAENHGDQPKEEQPVKRVPRPDTTPPRNPGKSKPAQNQIKKKDTLDKLKPVSA